MVKKRKALVLLSGGLDSLLAAKLLLDQGIEVVGLSFKSCFFDTQAAEKGTQQLKIPLKTIDFSEEHLKLVKNPPRGYGKAANPCLDCHLLMLKRARKIMDQAGFDFVATGEVLGERPFSQNKKALAIIAKESGLSNRLLRPLSAKLLLPSLPEKKGWVKRERLLNIQGRQRWQQIALAKKYRLSYPQPAGGCLLTDKQFGQKLFDLFKKWPDCQKEDVGLLKIGRHFWDNKVKIILGKNKEENEKLESLKQKGDVMIEPTNFPGPTALLRGKKITQNEREKAEKLIISYSKKSTPKPSFQTIVTKQ